MIRFLIYRPVSVIVLYVGMLMLAGICSKNLRTSLLPNVAIPSMVVLVEGGQYSAIEMEQIILAPIRRFLSTINGVEDLRSVANVGAGKIHLRFAYGSDMEKAFIETNEMIDLSLNDLPSDIIRPRVIKSRAEDLPVYYLSLTYNDDTRYRDLSELSEFAIQVLRRRLEQLPEIAFVDMHGQQSVQLAITLDENLLAPLDLDQKDIQMALENNHMSLESVIIKERAYQYLVRIGKPLSTIEDVENATFKVGGRTFRISDVGSVSLENQVVTGSFSDQGRPGISLAIIKSPEASLDALQEKLEMICKQIHQEEKELVIHISRNQTHLLKATLSNLRTSLVLGCLLAIGIVFLFYGQWRIPVIIGIIIPVSLLLTLLLFSAWGLTLNMISLAGLLLALGLMIDNGIIVLDNITQEWQDQLLLDDACVLGTNVMIGPLLTSMLTTCSVFVPLVFLSGLSGALFRDQAIAIGIGLSTSFIVSITLLPTLYFLLLTEDQSVSLQKGSILGRILRATYEWGYRFVFLHVAPTILIVGLLIGLAYYLWPKIPQERFPELPQKAFEVQINWDRPIRPDVSERRITSIFQSINAQWQAHIGIDHYLINSLYQGDLNTSSIYVERTVDSSLGSLKGDITNRIREKFPEAKVEIHNEKTAFEVMFPSEEENIEVRCYFSGMSEEEEKATYQEIVAYLKRQPTLGKPTEPDYDKSYVIEPILENIMLYDIDQTVLTSELSKALDQHKVFELNSFQYRIPVVIKGNPQDEQVIGKQISIKNRHGVNIPVHELVTIREDRSLRKIFASSAGRYWPAWIQTKDHLHIEKLIEELRNKYPNVKIELQGAYFRDRGLMQEMMLASLVSILLLYFLMAAQFESFLQPIIILAEIPISLCGAIFFLWIFGGSINIMSLIGMVVTTGIIINDSIIKIDTVNRLRKVGMSCQEAIHKGGIKRLNPIVMTSLTTILAASPFLFGSDLGSMLQRPLALCLIGGMIIGTLVSLYIVPLIYFFIYKYQDRVQK